MSTPKAKWWGYIRRILYDYPRMRQELDILRRAVSMAGPVEESILSALALPDELEQRELNAVEAVLTASDEDARKLIDMIFFRQTHTLQGAALALHMSYTAAKERQQWFIRSVAAQLLGCG